MDFLEQKFAAEVLNAERTAALMTKRGFPTTAAEVIHTALAELWEGEGAIDYSRPRIQGIVDRYVELDKEGEPQRRRTLTAAMRKGNVVLMKRK
jgi:hypothetical protein